MEPDSDPSDKKEELKIALLKERHVSRFSALEHLLLTLSPSERLLLYALSILLAISALALLSGANNAISVEVPTSGGSLTEGEVGPARFINPVLTLSQPDEDLSALVYSGLTRALPDGTIIPDLASNYDISADGTTYTFTIRQNATFQDGTPVTSADVLFTVQEAQDPDVKSPRRADWEGVVVSAPDAHTVVFKLPHAYAPFIQDTTMGILPQHLWKDISAEEFPFSPLNTHPIGSGPYEFSGLKTDSTGSATEYDLVPFGKFTLGAPYIKHLTFLFYPNDESMMKALNAHQIDSVAGISPDQLSGIAQGNTTTMAVPLPRVFGIFFNQAHATVLADASVRSALDAAIDKTLLVDGVLQGYGVPLDSPIPPGLMGQAVPPVNATNSTTTIAYTDATISAARAILARGGWTYDGSTNTWANKKKLQLSFTLATADSPQLVATAQAVAAAWKEVGATVTVQIYSLSDLNTNVIRPRQYDALLFGEVVGRELDLFAFWHSSQRNDPGLNLALYANARADTLLSQARATTNIQDRNKLYTQFAAIVQNDQPAVFLYAPDFIYVVPTRLRGIALGALTQPSERFLNVYQWYTDTERVWSFFTDKTNNVTN